MKKKILLGLCGLLCLSCLFGCEDKVNRTTKSEGNNRFIYTGDTYYISGRDCCIYYDSITRYVYICSGGNGGGISPMINKDGSFMTIDEYNETK